MSPLFKLPQLIVACSIAAACAGSVFAADGNKRECPTPTKEAREKMAAWHDQMAACLRSEKAIVECRSEMAKNHDAMMREMGCPGRKMHVHMGEPPQTSAQK